MVIGLLYLEILCLGVRLGFVFDGQGIVSVEMLVVLVVVGIGQTEVVVPYLVGVRGRMDIVLGEVEGILRLDVIMQRNVLGVNE